MFCVIFNVALLTNNYQFTHKSFCILLPDDATVLEKREIIITVLKRQEVSSLVAKITSGKIGKKGLPCRLYKVASVSVRV